jgi:NADH-quinone oxidoreductase subunit A
MPAEYLPLFAFALVALAFPIGTLLIGRFLRPSIPNEVKGEAYECGVPAESTARGRFSVQFFVIGILFVIFDAETVLLFPWAIRSQQLGWFAVVEALIFLAILTVGYVWAYKKGAFEWN